MPESKTTKSSIEDRFPLAMPIPHSPKTEAIDPNTTPERLIDLADHSVELARIVAKNLATPKELLTALSRSKDAVTRRCLASNPSIPPEVLRKVAMQFPEKFLDNPAIFVLLTGNPNLLLDLPASLLMALLKRNDCPLEIVRALQVSTHYSVRAAATLHVAVAGNVEDWLSSISIAFREVITRATRIDHLHCLPFLLLAGTLNSPCRTAFSSPHPLFDAIIQDAKCVYSNAETLNRLVGHHDSRVRAAIAGNTSTPISLLEILAGDKEQVVRNAVANNPATPSNMCQLVLERLANHEADQARCIAAGATTTPISLLERLAVDESANVRLAVAENPATPAALRLALLERLAEIKGRKHDEIRLAVALNSATPPDALERLAGDTRPAVRQAVAIHPKTSIMVLKRLAEDKAWAVRSTVALNIATPPALLDRLANDAIDYVRLAAAMNPATPVVLLEQLLENESNEIPKKNPRSKGCKGFGIALNFTGSNFPWEIRWSKATPAALLERLPRARECLDDTIENTIAKKLEFGLDDIERLASSTINNCRHQVAAHPATPVNLLEQLANDEDWQIRVAVVKNPATPVVLLKQLVHDEDDRVRYYVGQHVGKDPELLQRLTTDELRCLLRAANENPNVLAEALEQQAEDMDCLVRLDIAEHPGMTPPLLEQLFEGLSGNLIDARRSVAKHPATPLAIVECLLTDPDGLVYSNACSRLHDTPFDLTDSSALNPEEHAAAERLLARNVQLFSADADPSPRRMLALLSPWAPRKALIKHVRSIWWEERAAIAANPATPSPIRGKLVEDGNSIVRAAAREEISATSLAITTPLSETLTGKSQRSLATPKLRSPQAEVADPATTLERLAELVSQALITEDEAVLLRVCQNATATLEIIGSLKTSTFSSVRAAAALHVSVAEAREDWREQLRDAALEVLTQAKPAQRLRYLPVMRWVSQLIDSDLANNLELNGFFGLFAKAANRAFSNDGVLERLASDKREWVRSTVAENLHTPITTLERLAGDQKSSVRLAVALNLATPITLRERLLEQLMGDDNNDRRRAIAEHPTTPVALLERLAGDQDCDVREAVALNSATPVVLREQLRQLVGNLSYKWRTVAEDPSTPPRLLGQLACDEDRWIRAAVAKNTATPVPLLERLASDENSSVREAIAKNLTTPVRLLEKLTRDKHSRVRQAVAENPSTPVGMLEKMANDREDRVRLAVALNPSTPASLREQLLEKLASYDMYARQAIAEHPATPFTLLDRLSRDRDPEVRSHVAENSNTPEALLEQLAGDENYFVRSTVARHSAAPITLLEKLANDEESWVRRGVACNPSVPFAMLERLARDKEPEVREAVAENPITSVPLLEQLASDRAVSVRASVGLHPITPMSLLECLLHDQQHDDVLDAAKSGLNRVREDFVTTFSLNAETRSAIEHLLSIEIERSTATSIPSPSRLLALLTPWASVQALAKCSNSKWWEERAAIAANPNTPPVTRAKLAEDGNTIVRAAARAHAR